MTGVVGRVVPPLDSDLVLDLLIGPDPGPREYTDEQLELAWNAYKGKFRKRIGPPGHERPPWAARRFDGAE